MNGPRTLPDPPEGPTIRADIERVDAAAVAAASELPSSTLHEAAGRIGALPAAIRPVTPGLRLYGPAVTVHAPGGDNLWLHRAIYVARPGDVLVVSVSGAYDYGYWGEIMSTAAQVRGLGGLVIDGCVRDADRLAALGLPVFARGLSIRGTGKDRHAIGWVNAPVLIDEVTVQPGDLVVGDADGVVAIPRARAGAVIEASRQREAREAEVMQRLRAGERTLEIYGL